MKWMLHRAKLSVVFCLFICVISTYANAAPLFKISRSGNQLTIRTTIPNHTYTKAGIKIDSEFYTIAEDLSQCVQVSSGYCLFHVSDKKPKIIRLKRRNIRGMAQGSNTLRGRLCLNGESAISCQTMEVDTAVPGKIIGYLMGWETPPPAVDIKNAGYTHVLIAFGVFSTTTPGLIVSAANTIDPAYIQQLHDQGIRVLLSLGGASTSIPNTTVDFNDVLLAASSPDAFKATFIDSMNSFVQQYGFDGFDFDIEHGLIPAGTFTNPTGDIAVLADIINTFHAQHPEQLLTLAPQIANISATSGFNETFGNYSSLVMQTYASLEWVGIQLYNSGCAYGIDLICYDPYTSTTTPDPAVAFATDLLADWPPYTQTGQATGFQPYISYLFPSQVVLGYPVNNADGVSDGSPAAVISVIKRAVQCLNTKEFGPLSCDTYAAPAEVPFGVGGVFSWTINFDATTGYSFAKELYPCVVQGMCT